MLSLWAVRSFGSVLGPTMDLSGFSGFFLDLGYCVCGWDFGFDGGGPVMGMSEYFGWGCNQILLVRCF